MFFRFSEIEQIQFNIFLRNNDPNLILKLRIVNWWLIFKYTLYLKRNILVYGLAVVRIARLICVNKNDRKILGDHSDFKT